MDGENNKFIWREEYIYFFIKCMKTKPILWDSSHKNYRNREYRTLCYMDIAKAFKDRFRENIIHSELKKKWNNLKTYYTAHRQKIEAIKKCNSEAETAEILEDSIWKYYKPLEFLESQTKSLSSVNNFKIIESNFLNERTSSSEQVSDNIDTLENIKILTPEELNIKNEDSYSFLSMPSSPQATVASNNEASAKHHPKQKRKFFFDKSEILLEKCLKFSNQIQNLILDQQTTSQQSTFSHYIQEEIMKLDEDLQIQAKRRIANVIYELQEEQLERKSL